MRSKAIAKSFKDEDMCAEFNIDKETLTLYKESFQMFDIDGDGRITMDEISTLIQSLGYSVTHEHVKKMLILVDTDGNGVLDFKEFLNLMAASRPKSSKELKAIFDVFDKNGDGFIDASELASVMRRLNENLSTIEISEMITEADQSGQGKVNFEDFKSILCARN